MFLAASYVFFLVLISALVVFFFFLKDIQTVPAVGGYCVHKLPTLHPQSLFFDLMLALFGGVPDRDALLAERSAGAFE